MRFNLSKWALEHRSFVVYIMIAATIAGLGAFYRLGRDEGWFPVAVLHCERLRQ